MGSAPRRRDIGWFTRERVLAVVLAIATALALYVCYRIALPFIPPIAFALALAVATAGPYDWLRRHLPNDTAGATVAVILVTLLIVGPAALIGTYLVQQVADSVAGLQEGDGLKNWRQSVENIPHIGPAFQWAESRFDLQGQISRIGGLIAGQATAFLRGSFNVLTQLVIMLFVLFFLYRDRKQALSSLYKLLPLSTGEADGLFARVSSTIRATVNGSLTVAAVQAVLAGVMYGILGVPLAVLWAAATFLFALVPVFGTAAIWIPIAVYLAATGSLVKAAVLVGWGALAVGMIDNFLYPFLVGDKLRLHTVPTFFSVLGGISLFGPVGLILGPLALAITIGLLDVWWARTTAGQAADEKPKAETSTPPGAVVQRSDAGSA